VKTTQDLFNSFSDTVLLVGNGPIKNRGKLINSYDTVVRFNNFVLDGYEKDVGTKITAIAFPSLNLTQPDTNHLIDQYNKYVERIPIFSLNEMSPEYSGGMIGIELGTSLLGSGKPLYGKIHLTTGVAVAVSLALFFNKEVHLIGFDFLKTGHYWNTSHEHALTEHDGFLEEQLVRKIAIIKVL
jgi:hypothetical protein